MYIFMGDSLLAIFWKLSCSHTWACGRHAHEHESPVVIRQPGKVVKVNQDNFNKLNISRQVDKIFPRSAVSTVNTTRRTVRWPMRCKSENGTCQMLSTNAKFVSPVVTICMWTFDVLKSCELKITCVAAAGSVKRSWLARLNWSQPYQCSVLFMFFYLYLWNTEESPVITAKLISPSFISLYLIKDSVERDIWTWKYAHQYSNKYKIVNLFDFA